MQVVNVPRTNVNDDSVRLVEWKVRDGNEVRKGQLVAVIETSKATVEVSSETNGYFVPLHAPGSWLDVGMPFYVLKDTEEEEVDREGLLNTGSGGAIADGDGQGWTLKAKMLAEKEGLDIKEIASEGTIREEHVRDYLERRGESSAEGREEESGALKRRHEKAANWRDILKESASSSMVQTLDELRKKMKALYDRHVPTGSLLNDRWVLANYHGFGEGSSVYDECLILGDVTLGKKCWVGPFTVLDGAHAAIRIGNYTSIGAGSQVYTHNTIAKALTGYKADTFAAPTTIGACCFVAPLAIVAPGTSIGDHCFVSAGSYVEGDFPDKSFIVGNPAERVGRVKIEGDGFQIKRL